MQKALKNRLLNKQQKINSKIQNKINSKIIKLQDKKRIY